MHNLLMSSRGKIDLKKRPAPTEKRHGRRGSISASTPRRCSADSCASIPKVTQDKGEEKHKEEQLSKSQTTTIEKEKKSHEQGKGKYVREDLIGAARPGHTEV